MDKPLISGTFELKKGEAKGSWTFIEMAVLENVPKKRNSTVCVRGRIDDFEIRDFHIWAMKKGTFMAVKADIRKIIKKEAGDMVELELYLDDAPMVVQNDFLDCLKEEPALLKRFEELPQTEQQKITDWIFAAASDEEKINRMGKAMERLEADAK